MELKYQEQIAQLRQQMNELALRQQVSEAKNALAGEASANALQKKDVDFANTKFQEAQRDTAKGSQQTTQQVVQQVGQAMAALTQLAETMNQDVEAVPQPDGSWRRRRVPRATVQ
jgi:hypothetical protein